MFLQNERSLGVKNGTLGAIEHVSQQSMSVRTDDGRNVSFDLKDYNRIDHGYAATIHKALLCLTLTDLAQPSFSSSRSAW
jgi:ATP-dependent exoDNAse (exonuclease V) alpha subunit